MEWSSLDKSSEMTGEGIFFAYSLYVGLESTFTFCWNQSHQEKEKEKKNSNLKWKGVEN